jgi:hypothetical protein
MGYGELAERGISFCLGDLQKLVALTERVVREDAVMADQAPAPTVSLRLAGAAS